MPLWPETETGLTNASSNLPLSSVITLRAR